MSTSRSDEVVVVLERARELGFLGPGAITPHVEHSLAFGVGLTPPERAADLGSGGGVPGLVLAALAWPDCHWLLVDAGQRRAAFLVEAVEDLGLEARVTVIRARAEEVGRDAEHRGTCDLVTARGFGPPAIVAECGAPLLRLGGHLVVSEPPGGAPERWATAGMRELGLEARAAVGADDGPALALFEAVAPTPERYPRRVGIPAKRPLF